MQYGKKLSPSSCRSCLVDSLISAKAFINQRSPSEHSDGTHRPPTQEQLVTRLLGKILTRLAAVLSQESDAEFNDRTSDRSVTLEIYTVGSQLD